MVAPWISVLRGVPPRGHVRKAAQVPVPCSETLPSFLSSWLFQISVPSHPCIHAPPPRSSLLIPSHPKEPLGLPLFPPLGPPEACQPADALTTQVSMTAPSMVPEGQAPGVPAPESLGDRQGVTQITSLRPTHPPSHCTRPETWGERLSALPRVTQLARG